ncbi:MAG: hypothetical protein V4667_07040 [Bacteroidota bacterium]
MKELMYLLFFIPTILFGQQFSKIKTATETFYVLNSIDTLSIPKGLPDGKWKVFYDNDTSKVRYIFYLKDNKVDGPFNSYYDNGSWQKIGTYYMDSLWTFSKINSVRDTTFKIGLWSNQVAGLTFEDIYEIPYKNDSVFIEQWYYKYGQLLAERTHLKGKGLVKETWFYENGEKSSMFEKQKEYSIRIEWAEGRKITSVEVDQGLYYHLQIDTALNNRFYRRCSNCYNQSIFNKEGNLVSEVSFDENGNIRKYYGKGVELFYDENSKFESIRYWNRKNKLKIKRNK